MISELPTEEELQETHRFRTYLNYLLSLDKFIPEDSNLIIKKVIKSRSFNRIQGGRDIDIGKIGKLLRNAWCTEIQLSISSKHSEFLDFSNHWAPVQVYYACFLLLRAFFYSSNQEIKPLHSSTLHSISNEIKIRSNLFPYPWKVLCSGNPDCKKVNYENLPPGLRIAQISPLSNYNKVSFWDSFCMFLRTTRIRQLKQLFNEWKNKKNKKRISPKAKIHYIESLPPTSVFNCLYRLRLRSNYSDADSFLLSLHGTESAFLFNKSLKKLCWSTLLLLELLICKYISKQAFHRIVTDFRNNYRKICIDNNLIDLRWKIISSHL
jgi:hypothetical protein